MSRLYYFNINIPNFLHFLYLVLFRYKIFFYFTSPAKQLLFASVLYVSPDHTRIYSSSLPPLDISSKTLLTRLADTADAAKGKLPEI